MTLTQIVNDLYKSPPQKRLFHYTSLTNLMSIVTKRELWASEVRFVSDSAELKNFLRWIELAASRAKDNWPAEIIRQFQIWCRDVFSDGKYVFIGCFTENGNLLSQWRGYCPIGQGVSVSFKPEHIATATKSANYKIGKCIYSEGEKLALASRVLTATLSYAQQKGEAPTSISHPSQSYHWAFKELEADILSVAALIKDDAFSAEAEWRIVSPTFDNHWFPEIRFRAGKSTLIPFQPFALPTTNEKLEIDIVYVGPSPNIQMTMRSLPMLLGRYVNGYQVCNCQIPYRES